MVVGKQGPTERALQTTDVITSPLPWAMAHHQSRDTRKIIESVFTAQVPCIWHHMLSGNASP